MDVVDYHRMMIYVLFGNHHQEPEHNKIFDVLTNNLLMNDEHLELLHNVLKQTKRSN
jgi:hypothetical protein